MRGEKRSMQDHKRRGSLISIMNRRVFLATMGVAAGSVVMGTPLSGRRAWADQPTGPAFTPEDVKATYARIIWPPKGISIPRTPLFSAVREINIRDRYTVEFKLSEPRPTPFMLGAFASGWNILVRKKTLEDNDYNLRNVPNFPGTGPFRHVSRIDKEVWIVEKNPQYWNTGLPYLDRLEIYHLAPGRSQSPHGPSA